MSAVAVQEFLAGIKDDQALQAEVAEALQAENDRQAVTDLAKSKGFDFSPDELAQEIEAIQAKAQEKAEGGELSDEELEAVAGGEVGLTLVSGGILTAAMSAGVTFTIGAKNKADGGGPIIKW